MTIRTRADDAVADMRAQLDPDMAEVTGWSAAELAEIERQLQAMMARADREHEQEETETDD